MTKKSIAVTLKTGEKIYYVFLKYEIGHQGL